MTTLSEQTVDEFLFGPCAKSLLSELASEAEWWASRCKFVEENAAKKLNELTLRQRHWLFRIKDDLLREAGK